MIGPTKDIARQETRALVREKQAIIKDMCGKYRRRMNLWLAAIPVTWALIR